jgi:hypothetical protein
MSNRLKEPRVMLKVDIASAFDSVSWRCLFEILHTLGFDPRFCEWIANLQTPG